MAHQNPWQSNTGHRHPERQPSLPKPDPL